MMRSQNGLPANDRSKIAFVLIPGTSTRLSMRRGNVATVLAYVASEFDRLVEDIDTPSSRGYEKDDLIRGGSEPSRIFDDWGFAFRPVRGSTSTLSNHASGSAIDLNATQHPRGVRGTFTAGQVVAIREILRFCEGTVRWGGDYRQAPPDEMHFEINANALAVARVARKIRARAAAKEDDVTKDDIKAIASMVLNADLIPNESAPKGSKNPTWSLKSMVADIENTQDQHTRELAEVKAMLARIEAKLKP